MRSKSKSRRALSLCFLALITLFYCLAGDSLGTHSYSIVSDQWMDTKALDKSIMTSALEVIWDIVTYSF